MRHVLLALLLAGPAAAGVMTVGTSPSNVDASVNGTNITPAAVTAATITATGATGFVGNGSNLTGIPSTGSIVGVYAPLAGATFTGVVNASTITISLNAASNPGTFPYSPLMIFGNANTYLQEVLQNLSNGNNASGDIIITGDLGNDSAFYLDMGVNSSKFSQAGQSVEASSSTFLTSSDADLVLWAGTNGGANAAASETVILGSSNPVTGNRAAVFSSSTVSIFPPVTFSTTVYAGVALSTQAAGGAGALVTVSCPASTYALSGGCSCGSIIAETSVINMPFPTLTQAGAMPTGWQCQAAGGTGGLCSAYVICSRIRF